MTRTGYRYTFEDPRSAADDPQLLTAICEEEGYEFDGFCRDHEEDFDDAADPRHSDCDAYRAVVKVMKFAVPGGPPGESDWLVVRADEVLDRNGYCKFHDRPTKGCVNPHDHCKHGTYVGGCGIDWLCGACEMGD